jgi:hypothetical protein
MNPHSIRIRHKITFTLHKEFQYIAWNHGVAICKVYLVAVPKESGAVQSPALTASKKTLVKGCWKNYVEELDMIE